jgi:hypothetical protein
MAYGAFHIGGKGIAHYLSCNSFHSPSARKTKTATTLIPMAVATAPTKAPKPSAVSHDPVH